MIRVRPLVTSVFVALTLTARNASAQESADDLPLRLPRPTRVTSHAERLRTNAAPPDTIYVGYTPGRFDAATNWWSIGAGRGAGFHRPPAQGGMWDWEPTGGSYLHGDSLQGWWPRRLIYGSTGGQTRPDWQRPWWAVDIGNQLNYVLGNGQDGKRTFGVVGVWHRDNGSVTGAGATWAPLEGSHSAWMGLRRHGDVSFVDPITNNPFNDDCAMFNVNNAVSASGTDKGFPGYGSQWDQMLYRDIDMSADPGASLTITFRYRTNMSTGVGTASATRTGWFDKDPLQVTDNGGATNAASGNFISSSDAGTSTPRDSFMVYVGAPVSDGACLLSNGVTQPVFDPMRRWFSEVVRALEPGLHREIHGSAGDASPTLRTVAIPNTILAPMLAASGNRVRLVFRVKTNRGFDDEGTAYSSGGAGAAIVDDIGYAFGTHASPAGWGSFEQASSIDNALGVSAVDAWKSTGKPPSHYAHPHALADLSYQDLCGDIGGFGRTCNMIGGVLSIGDHDHGEAAGDVVAGTADRERWDGLASPTIQLCGPYPNPIGLASVADAVASNDYYLDYELYTGVFDPFTKGNMWWPGLQSYPSAAKASSGGYPTWGNVRYVPYTIFNPDVRCLRDAANGVKGNALMRWSSSLSQDPSIPDSIRLLWIKRQECFRFGVSTACSATDGAYLDNFSLMIVDAPPPPIMAWTIWDLFQDTFPANETAGLPATASGFDTTTAYVKTGNNIYPRGSNDRFTVPGDSAVVMSGGAQERVDLVFRILPGPGNYSVLGRPDVSPGAKLRATPNAAVPIAGAVPQSTNFWENYLADNGPQGTPGGHAGGLWDANVWNSARCDTAETAVFAVQHRGLPGGPFDVRVWRTTYHESELGITPAPEHGDPYPVVSTRAALGITRHRCYLASTSAATTNIDCIHDAPGVGAGYDLTYLSTPGVGWDGTNTTVEGTKILPDGLFTPGTHVEYFFRAEAGGTLAGIMPDTNVVSPQTEEGNEDGHRWQQFGVLPDRWKDAAYRHPVTGTFGAGAACLLVVDGADRRGEEMAWVGLADTIGLTHPTRFGAHNGWHARGDGSVNDPTGFVRPHLGQPGTAWDLYQVKGAETFSVNAGGIGNRLAFRDATNTQVNDKAARTGPTPEMLERFYRGIVYASGDLSFHVLGPVPGERTDDDVRLLTDWLGAGNAAGADRFLWAIGSGLVESNSAEGPGSPQDDFNQLVLGVDLRSRRYVTESGNSEPVPDLRPSAGGPLAGYGDEWGVRSICGWSSNVLERSAARFTETVTAVEYEPYGPGPFPLDHTIVKQHTAAHPWIAAVSGSSLSRIGSRFGNDTRGRQRFVQEMLMGPLAIGACPSAGFPPLDVPGLDAAVRDYVRFANNPLRTGHARIEFGLPVEDRVTARVYDVAGRLVRTLADRTFPAGEHVLRWDGADDGGARMARGVYFTRLARHSAAHETTSKIVVLQ